MDIVREMYVKVRGIIRQWRTCIGVIKITSVISRACDNVVEKDVVIVRTDAIGDFVIWLATAKYLRQYFENRAITLICRKINKELAEKTLLFDEVIAIDDDVDAILNNICGIHAEVLIQPMYSRNVFSEQIVSAVQCENKIAIDGDATNYCKKLKRYYDQQYTKIIKTPDCALHELERNRVFVEKLTGYAIKLDVFELKQVLQEYKMGLYEKYFVVNLGGSSPNKLWSVEKYAKCASYIKEKSHLLCVLIGSRSEQYLADAFLKQVDCNSVINIVGKTSVIEMMGIISNAALVMCNDTSTVHIAAACRVPCVCIAPGTYYPRFVPYPQNINDENAKPVVVINKMDCFGCINESGPKPKLKCQQEQNKGHCCECISAVTVERVLKELRSMIKKITNESSSS